MGAQPAIIYTKTDEAPELATRSFFPIIQLFASAASTEVVKRDISLAGRILAEFVGGKEYPDDLAELGELVKTPDAVVIKLPNISASVPQLEEAIAELQAQGYDIPNYRDAKDRYDIIKGSAVNPVLRQGNSDRRLTKVVKDYSKNNPPPRVEWDTENSKTHVSHMEGGDFFANEQSTTMDEANNVRIEFVKSSGEKEVLKELSLLDGEVIDATFMSRVALRDFIRQQIQEAKEQGVLFSVHLKATMMKVSDPIIFGHFVEIFCEDVFQKHADTFMGLGVDPNKGLGDIYEKIKSLLDDQRAEIEADIDACLEKQPDLYMDNVKEGTTNLQAPNKTIVDASMPPIIRWGGKSTGPDGKEHDVKAIIPDRTYAVIYKEIFEFCRRHGGLDPETMGSVPNVGLMADKAEEYGSHDKTFEVPEVGVMQVVDEDDNVLLSHEVEQGDIWRMCQTKDYAIKNWVGLAVERARESDLPAVFWLDESRPHDAQLIAKVNKYLKDHNTDGLDIQIMAPAQAMRHTLERVHAGKDTISVTGNVLRDWLTDLFPILETGTSAKMLSRVPLISGGVMFETGAGGSAPKHVEQFLQESHLRWDSIGEFIALAKAFKFMYLEYGNKEAGIVAKAMEEAMSQVLETGKTPKRKVGEPGTQQSHYWLARYWAESLAAQDESPELKEQFTRFAERLAESNDIIVQEFLDAQGKPAGITSYHNHDPEEVDEAVRSSATFNQIVSEYMELVAA